MPRRIRLVAFVSTYEPPTPTITHSFNSYYTTPKADNHPLNKAHTLKLKRLAFLSKKVYLWDRRGRPLARPRFYTTRP